MTIKKLKDSKKHPGLCRLRIDGDMTIYTAERTKQDLLPHIDDYQVFDLDLAKVNEIDTAGLQILLLLKRKADQSKRVVHLSKCSQAVRELLGLYHLQSWFDEQPAVQ